MKEVPVNNLLLTATEQSNNDAGDEDFICYEDLNILPRSHFSAVEQQSKKIRRTLRVSS